MARKKSRPARPPRDGSRGGSNTAVVAQPAVTGLATTPLGPSVSPAPARSEPATKVKKPGPDALWRTLNWLGSLQLAVIGLSLFAVSLAVGTIVESWYSGKLAQELVYRSWWFAGLIGVLGVTIFCAAAKKWPWKKHQAGFLITHVGLLMFVAGGILNALGGVDAVVILMDSNDPSARQKAGGARQDTHLMYDRDSGQFTVRWIDADHQRSGADEKVHSATYAFDPGSLPWTSERYARTRFDPLVSVLGWLAHPLPSGWSQTLPDGSELEVLAYYPYVREGHFRATGGSETSFPAVKVMLSSPMAGSLEQWVALDPEGRARTASVGPGMVEFLGVCRGPLLQEFLRPPEPKDLGDKGVLVLALGSEKVRLGVGQSLGGGQTVRLGGWEVKATGYTPDSGGDKPGAPPANPVVTFQLSRNGGKDTATYKAAARDAGRLDPVGRTPADLSGLQVWYHPPDYQYGQKSTKGQLNGLRALLQFAQGDEGQLYYRSFNTGRTGSFAFEKSGEAKASKDDIDIWSGMMWKLQLEEYLPAAAPEDQWVPEDLRPGSERNGYLPGARCRITAKDGTKSDEFWVLQFSDGTPVRVGKSAYLVNYSLRSEDLGFSLKLQRAEQTNDPGTQSAATYTSFVLLTDDEQRIKDEDHVITMNAPLYHRGYKLYQSGYEVLGVESGSEKPVSKSTLTVGYDPGIYFKYAGQIMLGLGIFTMFYMKAYFFKPRGRKVVPPPPDAGSAGQEKA